MKLSLGLSPRDYSVAGGVTYDADAQAYFTANTAITSNADKNAINTFYLGLKSDGVYTKIKAMYLPIWGSSSSSKWNLINNRSFDLTFGTGMTFTSGGMTPSMSFANTNLSTLSVFTSLHDKHLSFYSRTNLAFNNSSSIGSDSGGASPNYCRFTIRGTSDLRSMIFGGTNGYYTDTNSNSLGYYLANRSSSTSSQFYKNGILINNGNTATGGSSSQITQPIYICAARTGGTTTYYDNKQCAFASIGDSLTSTEQLNFYNNIQTLMTYFGINV